MLSSSLAFALNSKRSHSASSKSVLLLICLSWILGMLCVMASQPTTYLVNASQRPTVEVRDLKDAYHVIINMDSTPTTTPSGAPTNLQVDSTTQQIVSKFKTVITPHDEQLVAQKYIQFAEKVKQIADSIPVNISPEASALQQQLLAIVRDLTFKSEHPGVDMLQSTLKGFQSAAAASSQQQQASSNSVDGAQTLFLPLVLNAASLATSAIQGIGTYSDSLSKASQFLAGPVSQKLNQWGLTKVAALAERSGQSMDRFATEKLKPYEDKIATKIAPFVQSKTFQHVNNALAVVSSATSLKGGLKALGLVRKIKLPPGALQNVRSALKLASNVVKNRRQEIMNMIKKNPSQALKQFTKIQNRVERVQGQWEDLKGNVRTFRDDLVNGNNGQEEMSQQQSTNPESTQQSFVSPGNGGRSQERSRRGSPGSNGNQRRGNARTNGNNNTRRRGNSRSNGNQRRRNGRSTGNNRRTINRSKNRNGNSSRRFGQGPSRRNRGGIQRSNQQQRRNNNMNQRRTTNNKRNSNNFPRRGNSQTGSRQRSSNSNVRKVSNPFLRGASANSSKKGSFMNRSSNQFRSSSLKPTKKLSFPTNFSTPKLKFRK